MLSLSREGWAAWEQDAFSQPFFPRPATADIRTRCCNIVSVTDNSIRGSFSHCGNEPHHFFLSTHLNIAAMKKKNFVKMGLFPTCFYLSPIETLLH